jgi:ABC-2 type transport system ATP-binding protein
MTPPPLLEARGLTKRFDQFLAVQEVDLAVHPGEVLALLGPNGAGKTTTIRMLASILRPSAGWAKVAGFDVVQDAVEVRRRVGLLTEHHGLYTRMKAEEYLVFFGRTYGLEARDIRRRAGELLETYGLSEVRTRRLGEYSKGMRQKLALVRCLLHDPAVLLLDEPTSAMDPASARQVRTGIQTLRTHDRSVIVCTHNLAEAEMLADQIAIIWRGRIRACDTSARLKQAFLGDPAQELRLAVPLPDDLGFLPPEARPLARGRDWIRYSTPNPQQTNPALLRSLAESGIPALTLSDVGRTLEDVYLRVVDEAAGEERRAA